MQTLALVSQKGGAGKTTLALHLAVEAALRGRRTLIIDLDPQASTARWADRRQGQKVDIDVASEQSARLDAALTAATSEGYELVVVDTAPNADQTALRAARASELVLVPCRPSILDLDAIVATLELCTIAKASSLTILNAAPIRSRVVADAAKAIRKVGSTVCPVIVRERVAFRHALVDGRVAQEYEPDGQAAAEIAALYDAVSCKEAIAQAYNTAREIA